MGLQKILYRCQYFRGLRLIIGAAVRAQTLHSTQLPLHPLSLARGEFRSIGSEDTRLTSLIGSQRVHDACAGAILLYRCRIATIAGVGGRRSQAGHRNDNHNS
jgi:hypothetical protein